METPVDRIVLAVVAAVSAGSGLTLVLAALTRPAQRRAGLVATGLPLALLAPVVAAVYASGRLIGLFEGMAHGEGPAAFVARCRALWQLQALAWGGVAAVCLLGLVLGLARPGRGADDAPGSRRRQAVLLLLPLLGLLVAGALTREVARVLRLATAVFSPVEDEAEGRAQVERVLAEHGLPTAGRGSLAAQARFIDRGSALGLFGGATAGVVLLGLGLTGTILAWRVGFEAPFRLAASALWLLAAAGGVLAGGVVDPLRLPLP